MSAIVSWIEYIVALTLMGVFATFFVLTNWIKQKIEREDNGKASKQDIL